MYNFKAVMVTQSFKTEWGTLEHKTEDEVPSIRKAWAFFERDLYHHRKCSKTRVFRYGGKGAIFHIQHIASNRRELFCDECEALREARMAV